MDISREEVIALRRYYLWANEFRVCFYRCVTAARAQGIKPDELGRADLAAGASSQYLSFWLAALHVVTEGWEDAGLTNVSVGRLLEHTENRKLLKRYRNGVYHFQRSLTDKRFGDLLSRGQAIVPWVVELHDEFGRALFPERK